ncbi:hypothetical protein OWV82_003393 [Melia azedarach]|uniref:Uncharacterized protein n=1 Tax=Melia azedarach TaxID=155640 RepID=A0ACC1YLJ9_MELAZ|nr:hypothetical protein OWV82_003393 [Melia azedarach]
MSKRSGGVGCGTGSSKREGKKLGFQSHRMMGMLADRELGKEKRRDYSHRMTERSGGGGCGRRPGCLVLKNRSYRREESVKSGSDFCFLTRIFVEAGF